MHTLFRRLGRSLNSPQHRRIMASACAGSSSGGESGSSSGEGSRLPGKHTNRLIKEKSPYLLQHASNPVNWYPWGDEAFKAAVNENKLIFLSVGYSTCHWCHVMERESFENEEVAEVMNQHFINIKVDREERPDVDKVYMTFVTSMSGSGGWPMSVWLTPDLHPVYGGTYFPPTNSYIGRPGFTTVLQALAQQWTTDETKVRSSGTAIVAVLQKNSALPKPEGTDAPPLGEASAKCLAQLAKSYEPEYGGFSDSPKFPQPSNLNFLFSYYLLHPHLEDAKKGLDMALHTLTMMAHGGIHDHVGQGFARYSTDRSWHVPHFEKMLYDQAQLTHAFLHAYLVTRRKEYADVVRDILEYVMRDLSHESGGFYCAEDADSLPTADSTEKKEGAFCVWTYKEIHSLLSGPSVERDSSSPALAELFCHHYSVIETGNVDPYKDPHGELVNKNVLLEHGSIEETAQEFSLSETEVRAALATARKKLYQERLTRPKPHLDDKMLTAWNGMMLSAISRAGAVLSDPAYLARAVAAARFITGCLTSDAGRLYRAAYRDEQGQVTLGPHQTPGFCDDYAWSIRGLVVLYEATLDQCYLVTALDLQTVQDTLFWDEDGGGYYSTQQGDRSILMRLKDDHDSAEPSVNSVSAGNLLRLSRLLDRPDLLAKCQAILRLFSDRLTKIPITLPEMTAVQLMMEEPTSQVILSGDPQSGVMKELINVVHSFPHPNRVVLVAPPEEGAPLYTHQPSLLQYRPQPSTPRPAPQAGGDPPCDSGQVIETAKAYVCYNFVCSLPMTKPEQLRKSLEKAFLEATKASTSS